MSKMMTINFFYISSLQFIWTMKERRMTVPI